MSFNPYEPDMDSFFDFDSSFHNPTSPTTAFAGTVDPSKMMLASDSKEERKAFAGPSYEYDRFKQLTGIPNGSVSNFSAMNDMTVDSMFSPAMAGPSSSQFNFTPDMNTFDMDFDFSRQDPLQNYFYPTTTTSSNDFIDPLAVVTQEVSIPPNTSRMWPGMHSKQAEQAKAEALARQQRQQQIGQQIMQQRQQQQSLQSQTHSSPSRPSAQPASSTSADPLVEDRISRLLDQMRHNSTTSSNDEEANDNSSDALRSARMRKDEDDMDEDERLLASEQGKKLSSKERRQLRNKVSARAFRSRRKEYITQLEAELAVKSTECNEYKAKNRQLQDQNEQLTRLTQTLLRHPAFNTFLNDMSNDPSILDLPVRNSHQSNGEEVQPPMKQEPIPESIQDTQVNLAMMPHTGLDLSMLSLGPAHWNPSTNFNFQQPQVFAVLEVPRGPVFADHFGLSKISGGKVSMVDASSKLAMPKLQIPSFAATETSTEVEQEQTHFDATGIDKDDPSFALYLNTCATTRRSAISPATQPAHCAVQHNETRAIATKPNAITLFLRPNSSCRTDSVTDATAIQQINNMFDAQLPILQRLRELTW